MGEKGFQQAQRFGDKIKPGGFKGQESKVNKANMKRTTRVMKTGGEGGGQKPRWPQQGASI